MSLCSGLQSLFVISVVIIIVIIITIIIIPLLHHGHIPEYQLAVRAFAETCAMYTPYGAYLPGSRWRSPPMNANLFRYKHISCVATVLNSESQG